MNKKEMDLLLCLKDHSFDNQRQLARAAGLSLGAVNQAVRNLIKNGLLDRQMALTEKAEELIAGNSPQNAVILAAGFGMRMVPINMTTPKALVQVHGECLIERLIKQLKEKGICDITVVVGYMMDSFEYLIDDFGVELLYNDAYASKNNLFSLALAADKISQTYVVPCDIWCRENPFRSHELYSWYMVNDKKDPESDVRVNRKKELVRIPEDEAGNGMTGIAYLTNGQSDLIREKLKCLSKDRLYDGMFWESALYEKDKMQILAREVRSDDVVEVNTYEELRELDAGSNHLQSDALDVIAKAFSCNVTDIVDIEVLKKGMTNRSFLFSVKGEKYIMRIPGEGTDQLIDRKREAAVYMAIRGKGICDDVVYINPENGFKITKYLEGIRVCDQDSVSDLTICMKKLREFHEMKLKVDYTFDIFGQIAYYESLWDGASSVYRDYKKTKENVFSLKPFIEAHAKEQVLTHIDAVPDNFLFCTGEDGKEDLQLTDWEYAGMQDPHVDLAMFSIYSLYDKSQIDRLLDIYFEGQVSKELRAKIYCYVAACGLLWSNWCEFKRKLGVEFGEYSLRQYRYAKDYYLLACREIEGI